MSRDSFREATLLLAALDMVLRTSNQALGSSDMAIFAFQGHCVMRDQH